MEIVILLNHYICKNAYIYYAIILNTAFHIIN